MIVWMCPVRVLLTVTPRILNILERIMPVILMAVVELRCDYSLFLSMQSRNCAYCTEHDLVGDLMFSQ